MQHNYMYICSLLRKENYSSNNSIT
jgi:hypothetical protein